MKFIDLSYPINNDIKVHPLDSPSLLIQEKYFKNDGYNYFRMETGLHTGTHIDAPMHLTENKKYISEYDLDRFCGSAVIIDVRDEFEIKYKEIYNETIKKDDIVLFYTGHDSQYGKDNYFTSHPLIDPGLAEFLVLKKIRMAGFDLPSPDNYPYVIHKILLENDIMILENLRNMKNLLNRKFELFAFPLAIESDSSIVRAVAGIIEESD